MINEFNNYTPTSLRHALGEVDPTNTVDLSSALMVLCDLVQALQKRVKELENTPHIYVGQPVDITELHDQVQPEVRE